jgi:hypothetical protein
MFAVVAGTLTVTFNFLAPAGVRNTHYTKTYNGRKSIAGGKPTRCKHMDKGTQTRYAGLRAKITGWQGGKHIPPD